MDRLYAKLLDTNGIEIQVSKLVEECGELIAIAGKWLNTQDDLRYGLLPRLYDEIADVEIMIEQMNDFFDSREIKKIKEYKLKRISKIIGFKEEK